LFNNGDHTRNLPFRTDDVKSFQNKRRIRNGALNWTGFYLPYNWHAENLEFVITVKCIFFLLLDKLARVKK